jgi:hypothetical protein
MALHAGSAVKRFLQILAGSALLFVVLAMIEERETFTRNWFEPPEAFRAAATERRAAAETVHAFRTLAAHWYGTGGDARFGERLPAAPQVLDELRADIAYVRANGRLETPRLMRIEFLASDVTSENEAEVRTREYWVTEFHWSGGGVSDHTRSDVLFARYRLGKDGARWVVTAWDPVDAPGGGAP